MPVLIDKSFSIHRVPHRRTRFTTLRVGQIFYAHGRWWQKATTRTATRADTTENEFQWFKGRQMIRTLDEDRPSINPSAGLSYDEFMSHSAL